jgi:hypothetical protein
LCVQPAIAVLCFHFPVALPCDILPDIFSYRSGQSGVFFLILKEFVIIFFFQKYYGVYWHKASQQWKANLYYKRKNMYLGLFENELDAARKVNEKCEVFSSFFLN